MMQACGRTFITTWNQQSQQWGTRELPQDHDGLSLPHLLPKIVEVTPSCLLLPPPSPSRYKACLIKEAADCESAPSLTASRCNAPFWARFAGLQRHKDKDCRFAEAARRESNQTDRF
eukprot:1159675-Pelagomonas_calceolata.AAC.5